MGILRDKTVCKKNPHISKRKGGKKLPHRRFSLQVIKLSLLYQKWKNVRYNVELTKIKIFFLCSWDGYRRKEAKKRYAIYNGKSLVELTVPMIVLRFFFFSTFNLTLFNAILNFLF